jgi:predicted acyl esterase
MIPSGAGVHACSGSPDPPFRQVCSAACAFTLALLYCAAVHAQDNALFTKTDAMIPVRDGVKLHTVIFALRDAHEPLPILLERTPYGAMADEQALRTRYAHLIADGYIFAFQDWVFPTAAG